MTTEPTDAELVSCPFCGGDAREVDIDGTDETVENAGGSLIECTRCFASSAVHFDRKENLVSSWNERAASRLSRRPADAAPEGVRQQCINVAWSKLLTSQAREAVEIADAILALVSPAATRRAALEEVAKWIEDESRRDRDPASLITAQAIAAHCRRLAQQGGE